MTWQATPYPHYAPPSVSFANHWHRHCLNDVTLTLGALSFGAGLDVKGVKRNNGNSGMVLDCKLGDSSFSVHLTEDALEGLLDDVVAADTLQTLDELWRLALIEAALTPLADALQEQLGLALKLVQARPAEEPLPVDGLRFGIRSDGVSGSKISWFLTIALADDPPAEVLEHLRRAGDPASKDVSWLPLPVVLEAGRTSLPLAMVESLEIGDIIMLCDDYYLSENCLRVDVSGQLSCMAMIDGNSLTLQTLFDKNTEDNMANTGEEADGTNQLAELQINLVFVAGRLQLTVGELQEIQPGHVFDLRQAVDRHIEITANGAVIGTGELVEIDGRAGVRVHECK